MTDITEHAGPTHERRLTGPTADPGAVPRAVVAVLAITLFTLLALMAFVMFHLTDVADHQSATLDRQNHILTLVDELIVASPPRPGQTITPQQQQILNELQQVIRTTPPAKHPATSAATTTRPPR